MHSLPAVLLVDDDSTTNYINKRLLERLEVCQEILVALNGQQALDLLQARHRQGATVPALVLVDINMPVMDGFEFLDAYVRQPVPATQTMVFIMLTSSQLDEDMARIQHLPVADFLHKPLTSEKLQEVMQRYFP